MSGGLSSVLTGGVGRRILGLFFVAALLPVIFTAFLAFNEVGRGLEQDLNRELREISKSYGISILTGLEAASEKAAEVIRIIEEGGADAIKDRHYLIEDFSSISVLSPKYPIASIHGLPGMPVSAAAIDFDQLAAGKSQLIETTDSAKSELILLRGTNVGKDNQAIFSFQLRPESFWASPEHLPYETEFCAFSDSGITLHCTAQMNVSILPKFSGDRYTKDRRPVQTIVRGEEHLAGTWELFITGRFSHPSIHVVSSQPKVYALRSGADFRRVFPPALILVILLVGTLSFNLIGQSLVPLQRLTMLARQFAAGDLAARVRIRTSDEFESLADAFNHMAGRLDLQIATLKAMSEIDRSILSGAEFEEVSEDVIDHLIDLTGYESAAIIARDVDGRNEAKMISWCEGQFIHERISLPQHPGHDWCRPSEVQVKLVDPAVAPYRERFLSFGMRYVLMIPVILNDDLKGILLLGSNKSFETHGSKVKRCIDLAGRLAVALASVEREEALHRQAHFDELTGLPNRQLLKDRLEVQLAAARRNETSGAILFLDLDRFKEINDVFGHSVGDIVLTQAAERIIGEVRDTDTVARLGGDEFVVVIPEHATGNTLRMAASRILTRLAEPFPVRGSNHFLSASIGIVVFPDDGDSVETLLQNADAAMYRAKDAGRSRFEFFSKTLNAESRRKIELERDLRTAFDDEKLEVFYQPQFNLKDGEVWGAEALMRWHHGEQGFVPPNEFIQLAEDSGLIVDMGRWVMEQTCTDLRTILDMGLHPGSMSINVSARQLKEGNFVSDVLDALQRHDIYPGYLQLEITETAVAQNRDSAINTLNLLRDAGVQVAIDDFGTGYSSLSYLQNMPFDLIKIDKSFIDMIGKGGSSENICRTIIKMAHELGKNAIAEGVESQEQADFLIKNGCDFVQGYFYSHPLPQDEFHAFVEKQDFHTQRRKALEIV
jgi:diguanylate cyclase (GGDEF)-like protein